MQQTQARFIQNAMARIIPYRNSANVADLTGRMLMSTPSLFPTRRSLLAMSAAAGALSLVSGEVTAALDGNSIRTFRINIPEKELADLRLRIAATS